MNNDSQFKITDADARLERAVHNSLRALPDRAAPDTLEARVFAEIARRAALPWWRQSFAHWPLAARIAFLVVSAAAVACVIFVLAPLFNSMPSASQIGVADTFSSIKTLWSNIAGFVSGIINNLPPIAVAFIIGGIVASYATLVGCVAVAYRYLWKTHQP